MLNVVNLTISLTINAHNALAAIQEYDVSDIVVPMGCIREVQ